ncbi:MAG: nitroreductase family protein [Oscillospiraceae bacterium]
MANDFLTLIKTRRSIRAYKPDAVPADVLARVLEAGTYAPSAMGKQSATIVAVETKAYRDRLTKLNAAVIGKNVDPYYGAPVIVVVLGDGESANYLADGSCVLENLMLAAHAEGLGTVWVNREREIFDSPTARRCCATGVCRKRCAASARSRSATLPALRRRPPRARNYRPRLSICSVTRPPEFRRAGCWCRKKDLSQSMWMIGSVSSAAVTLGLW